MALSVTVNSLDNTLADYALWKVKITLKGTSLSTRAREVVNHSITYNEVLDFTLPTELTPDDPVTFSVLAGQSAEDLREIGVYSMLVNFVIENGYINIKESLLDIRENTLLNCIGINLTAEGRISISALHNGIRVVHTGQTVSIVCTGQPTTLDLTLSYSTYEGKRLPSLSVLSSINSVLDELIDNSSMTENSPLITTNPNIAYASSIGSSITDEGGITHKPKRKRVKLLQTLHKPPAESLSALKVSKWVTARVGRKLRHKTKDKQDSNVLVPVDESLGNSDGVDAEPSMMSSSSESSLVSLNHPYSEKNKEVFFGRILKPNYQSIAQDYQVSITVIEIRQLQGLNLNPLVVIQVGDDKKKTSCKESTNCPYYEEYFVFDYHISKQALMEKIITLTVYSSSLLTKGKPLGQFKLEVGTVYRSPGHQIYHKWATLTESDDPFSENKGYLQCDIGITHKDTAKIVPDSSEDHNEIDKNLLLPPNCTSHERQKAKIVMKIYRAEDLPYMNLGLLANMKKAFTGETADLVDPYVQISYAGMKSRTSVKKGQCAPVWNEAVSFVTMIPSLCNTIQVQLRDKVSVTDDVIGTHYIDLSQISNTGTFGYLPTFGPCWINLYGSEREVHVMDEHKSMNVGQGEGIAYRGRLLVAITGEIIGGTAHELVSDADLIDVSRIPPVTESSLPSKEDFFLHASLFEVTMINPKFKNQAVQILLSFGNSDTILDIPDELKNRKEMDKFRVPVLLDNENSPLLDRLPQLPVDSTYITHPQKPYAKDRQTYSLFPDAMPCLFVQSQNEDTRSRLYLQNVLESLSKCLGLGISQVKDSYDEDLTDSVKKINKVVNMFMDSCDECLKNWPSDPLGSTKLDRERRRVCRQKLESSYSKMRSMQSSVTHSNLKEKLRQLQSIHLDLIEVIQEPQDGLPDVFIWLVVNGKKTAYYRLPARDIIYSSNSWLCGTQCSKICTLSLKLPGKRSSGSKGWTMQAQVTLTMWLGIYSERFTILTALPPGNKSASLPSLRRRESTVSLAQELPSKLSYTNSQKYQLRAYIYQARAIIGSDSSGLSDPFANITFAGHTVRTQVIDETLSPTWNQMLIIDDVTLPFSGPFMKQSPPVITIELYDYDKIGRPEYLGRTYAYPVVKLSAERYEPPVFPALLQWWYITRGNTSAGELLASFELLEKPFDISEMYQVLLTPRLTPSNRRNANIPESALKGEVQQAMKMEEEDIVPIPGSIRPTYSKHRIEVLFWGVRDMKKLQFTSVTKPRIDVECAGRVISSLPLLDANKNPNFSTPVMHTDLDLPEDQVYCPPITIRCVDCRSFGRFVLVGTHTINSLQKYLYKPKPKCEDNVSSNHSNQTESLTMSVPDVNIKRSSYETPSNGGAVMVTNYVPKASVNSLFKAETKILGKNQDSKAPSMTTTKGPMKPDKHEKTSSKARSESSSDIDFSTLDWWSKYYASIAKVEHQEPPEPSNEQEDEEVTFKIEDEQGGAVVTVNASSIGEDQLTSAGRPIGAAAQFDVVQTFKIYDKELEEQQEFDGFSEWLHTFNLYRGKKAVNDDDDDNRIVGKFKGCLQIYKNPFLLESGINIVGGDLRRGMFAGIPSNGLIKVLVRVYVVLAKELHPADLNGKADPYLVIKLGSKTVNDVENYIPKQLNPIFGRCFEQEVTFPMESQLTVQIWDWDLLSKDDLIGETKIDLENRFYSKHRATCGVQEVYQRSGYNEWRDRDKPSVILSKLCKERHLDPPHYRLHQGRVTVAGRDFVLDNDDVLHLEENLALQVLKRWNDVRPHGCTLVPEHVETRSLYNPEKPGIEQGKVQMWVDMFSMDQPVIPKAVDISPRKPAGYELRVIIWNTDEVILEEDDFFTGEKSSDIYVKGWVTGKDNSQSTDVHYRSLTGEGNFNWRFVLPFEYLVAEQKIVVRKRETPFSWDESEIKIPAKLTLQVWDADHISADDFLGSFTADLSKFPRAAKSMESCSLIESSMPTVNLFKQKRIKGWWPFQAENGSNLAGKVEAEIELLTAEEAEKRPVGEGRNAPEPLDKPNRPDTAFLWFLNPLKSAKYLFCKRFKWLFVKILIMCSVILLVVLLVYNIPGYTAKKMIGA